MKPVAAQPGDTVEFLKSRLCRKWQSASEFRAPALWEIQSRNRDGLGYFLIQPSQFDSRYFGAIRENRIRHHLRSLLT
jgi:type IV secretory pathway protease TraF